MIPIKLTIQGLYSYQEKQVIDFTRLTSANLFGIFGSVGSGKSSILEAITFAIYGKTDRLNLTGDNRNYNMMNLKSSELLIEFDFETGKTQTAYKVVVRGKRNGKKFEEVRTLDRTAYRKEEGSWIPIEVESLEKAIGLSYDNFKRTIIIPQGQFQEFLQLGNKDRTQMMKELFNLERFEMFYKVTSLEFKNNAQKQNIEGQLQQLGPVDEEQVKLYEGQIIQSKKEIDQLSQSLLAYQNKVAELDKLQQLVKKMEDAQLHFNELKKQEPDYIALEASIFNYEQCIIYFKSLVDALTLSNQRIGQKSNQIEQETAQFNQSEHDIQKCEATFAQLKSEYDRRDLLKQRADELVKIARLNVLSANVVNDEVRLTKGRSVLDNTLLKAEELKREKDNLDLQIKSQKEQLPDLSMLSKVKTWHVENNNLVHQLGTLRNDIQKHEKERERINVSVAACFNNAVLAALPKDAAIHDAVQFLKDHILQVKQQVAKLDHEIEHLRVQAKLDEYAVNLKDGEACPLCGSLQHPLVFSAESLAHTLENVLKQKQLLEKQMSDNSEQIMQLSDLATQSKFNLPQIKEINDKITQLENKLSAHKAQFQWNGFGEESQVSQAFMAAETIQKEIKQKEMTLAGVAAQLEKENQNKERFQKEIEKIQTSLTIGQTEIKTLSEQIRLLKKEEYHSRHDMEIESEKLMLLQKHASLEKQFNDLTNQLNQLRKVKDTVGGSLEAHRKELLQEQQNNAELQKKFSVMLEKAGYESEQDVRKILAQEMNLDQQKKKLNDFRHELANLQSQVKQLQQDIDNRTYDGDEHRKIRSEVYTVTESLNQKNQLLGRAAELLRKLKSDLENKALLQEQYQALELRAENIRVMKSLFKGSGFVNFISSVYLQNLCNAANERFFQLTRQKLSLEITEDNSFEVRDFMNGGKLRSVKTLSGGQTFQAALSLALALADNIQKITDSNQNFFFLDEGFGSLDKDSLAVVFDSLKSLRKENRIVGVISHVEEMQQEIDTHLRIENHEETGSRIKTSWD
ncbi:MAG TPA: SMC family ATPase [Prolixibacteraceae bacterium]|nr:SMC family ATPase [Prolixibacteraceae bacterium]